MNLCRVPKRRHTAKMAASHGVWLTVPFAVCLNKTHGKDPCHVIRPVAREILPWVTLGTRQRLCRVPEKLHTAKAGFADACLPCALCRVRHTANPLPWAFRALPCPAKGASPVVI